MNYILFDGTSRNALLPFTFTRPVADIRIGILTIREKWEKYLNTTTTTVTEDYLSDKYPMVEVAENILINASFLPNESLVEKISLLQKNQAIFKNDEVIAFFTFENQEEVNFDDYEIIYFDEDCLTVEKTWDIFAKNDRAIREDFTLLTSDRKSQPIPKSVNVKAEIKRFTEGTIEIPITIENKPDNIKINYFPKSVTLSYYVDLDNYNGIATSDFIVECNYADLEENQTYFVPKVLKKPEFVKRISIKQKRIDFIKL
jgi:hypothetical protein